MMLWWHVLTWVVIKTIFWVVIPGSMLLAALAAEKWLDSPDPAEKPRVTVPDGSPDRLAWPSAPPRPPVDARRKQHERVD